jgi:hypothetical protein
MTFGETLSNYITRVFCRNLTRIVTVHRLLHVYLYASTTVSGHLGQRRNKWKQNNERENILIERERSREKRRTSHSFWYAGLADDLRFSPMIQWSVRALEMPSSQDQDGPTAPEHRSTRIHGAVIFNSSPLSGGPGFESRMCYQIRSLWVSWFLSGCPNKFRGYYCN